MAEQLTCVECGRKQRPGESGWRAYPTDEEREPAEAVVFCPKCAEREFWRQPPRRGRLAVPDVDAQRPALAERDRVAPQRDRVAPRRLAAGLIVAALALGAVLATGLVLLLRDSDDENGALATMSARERPMTMAVPEIVPPNTARLTGEVLLIGERAGVRFFRLPRDDGSSCWGYGDLRFGAWQLLGANCETGSQRFPDPEQPVMPVSGLEVIPHTQVQIYATVAGFAADGVKRMAVIDAQDRVVPITEVVGNTYYSVGRRDRVKALVGLDEANEVIWRSGEIEPEE